MEIVLFDDTTRYNLLPFTHTRPIADIRCGIYTMRERWELFLKATTSTLAESYLQPVFPLKSAGDNLLVSGRVFANAALAEAIKALQPEERS
ncbi:MAG TPA: putative sugar nucleotidyl transferase, partial [Flavipsychrobacter sp.]|nr:putative sugar nucleotidyl transferase [Flavipsychrobacter sp.]